MAVTTTPSIKALFKRLENDFRNIRFVEGADFLWDSELQCIIHPKLRTRTDIWDLLHEISHALLSHTTYDLDIELVRMEAAAWDHAKTLAAQYNLSIDEDHIEDYLDTYRQWLYARSLCPACQHNGVQKKDTYRCLNCRCQWRANEARICALRRTKLRDQSPPS